MPFVIVSGSITAVDKESEMLTSKNENPVKYYPMCECKDGMTLIVDEEDSLSVSHRES